MYADYLRASCPHHWCPLSLGPLIVPLSYLGPIPVQEVVTLRPLEIAAGGVCGADTVLKRNGPRV